MATRHQDRSKNTFMNVWKEPSAVKNGRERIGLYCVAITRSCPVGTLVYYPILSQSGWHGCCRCSTANSGVSKLIVCSTMRAPRTQTNQMIHLHEKRGFSPRISPSIDRPWYWEPVRDNNDKKVLGEEAPRLEQKELTHLQILPEHKAPEGGSAQPLRKEDKQEDTLVRQWTGEEMHKDDY